MPRKKRKRINFLKLFMVDGNPSKFDKSEKSDVYLEPADKNDRDDEQNLGVCLEGGDVNFDNAESEGHFDSLPSGSYSLSSESGFDECISTDAKEMIRKRNSDLFILNTMSSSKSKTGNVIGKTAWEALNKSGTRWVIKSFIKFGRSSFISKSILNSLGTYLFDSIWWFETDLPLVALTIDDVPGLDPETNKKILDLLNEYNIKCTFFVTERNARYIKDADSFLKRCINEGHELGNHLAKDIPAHKLSISTFTKHLLECEHLITKYSPEHIFTNTRIFPPMFSSNFRNNNITSSSTTPPQPSTIVTLTTASSSSPSFPPFCLENESIGINWKIKSLENEKQEKNEREESNKMFEHKELADFRLHNSYDQEQNLNDKKDQENENSYFGKIIKECTNTIESLIYGEKSSDSINDIFKNEENEMANLRFKWFRPPFGRLTKQQHDLVVSRGYTIVMCDVYPNDVSFQGFPQFLAQFCTSNAAPGSIVCLHIPSNKFRSANIEVLRLLLPEISRRYKCVTLSELATQIYKNRYSKEKETDSMNLMVSPINLIDNNNSSGNSFVTIKSSESSPKTIQTIIK